MTPIPLSCPDRVTATATTAQIVTMTENRKKTRAAGHHGAGVGGPNPSTMRRLSAPPAGDASRMRARRMSRREIYEAFIRVENDDEKCLYLIEHWFTAQPER